MKTVMVGDRRFKLPFIDLIQFDEDQDTRLGDAIKEASCILVPVVCWKEKHKEGEDTVIDGAHRVQWAASLGYKVPVKLKSFKDEDEAREVCELLNLERRHLGTSLLQEMRVKRVERVASARAAGESLRAIAEAEAVSKSQVERDISTVPPGTVAPEKVTGLDGRTYTKKPAILCQRCARVGAVKNCPDCKAARAAAKGRQPGDDTPTAPVDNHGVTVPKPLRDRWGDPWIQTTIEAMTLAGETFRQARYADDMEKRRKFYPFIMHQDFKDGVGFVSDYFDKLVDHLTENRPAAVCPRCEGKKCGECMHSGLVPERVYQELTREKSSA